MRKKAVRIPRSKRAAISRKFQKLIREGYSEAYAARRAYHGRDSNKITAAQRRGLKPSQFALPQRKQLPIHNPSHVRNAAARLAQMHKRGTVTEREYASALGRILKAEKAFGIQRTHRDERWNEGYGIHAANSRKHVDAYFAVKPDAMKGAKALAETTGQPVHILRLPSGNIIDEVHPSFQVGRHARDSQASGDLYEIVDKHGNLLGTASHFGRAITQANEFGESSRLRPVTVFKDRKKVATSWGYRRGPTARDNSTHGRLNRYVLSFPSTREAENFHQSIDYVFRKDPASITEIRKVYDGKTVIIYAYTRYWDKKSIAKEAKIRGGTLTAYGSSSAAARRDTIKNRKKVATSRDERRTIQNLSREEKRELSGLRIHGKTLFLSERDKFYKIFMRLVEKGHASKHREGEYIVFTPTLSVSKRDTSPRCHVGTEIQSVILDNKYFDRRDALGWIRRHGFHAKKIDATEESFRFRQQEPSQFDHDSFRTITLRPGVKAVIGCPR